MMVELHVAPINIIHNIFAVSSIESILNSVLHNEYVGNIATLGSLIDQYGLVQPIITI